MIVTAGAVDFHNTEDCRVQEDISEKSAENT
jgi:hypothetical protein